MMKDEFIKHTYNENYKKQYKVLLEVIYNYELKVNKDLKDFNEDECGQLLKELSFYQIKTTLIFIKKYKEFCSAMGIDVYEMNWDDEKLQVNNYKYKIESKVISKEDYKNIIMTLSDNDDTSLYFKVLFMLIYEGIPKYGEYFKDIFCLRKRDIYENTITTHSDRKIVISDELVDVLNRIKNINQIVPHNRKTILSKVYKDSLFYFPGDNPNSENPTKQEIKKAQSTLNITFNRFILYKFNISISLNDILKSYFVNEVYKMAKPYIHYNGIAKVSSWNKETMKNVEDFLIDNGYSSGVFHFIRLNEINLIKCAKSS